jgi:NAD(P)-dependent dehydrogenase (short-subunit alcohol dehydrogenase family)
VVLQLVFVLNTSHSRRDSQGSAIDDHTSSWRLNACAAAALALSLPVAHSSPLQPRLRCHACRLVSSRLNVGLVPLYALYLGAAAAVEQYSKAASKEFAHRRISVNCVAPVRRRTPCSDP